MIMEITLYQNLLVPQMLSTIECPVMIIYFQHKNNMKSLHKMCEIKIRSEDLVLVDITLMA